MHIKYRHHSSTTEKHTPASRKSSAYNRPAVSEVNSAMSTGKQPAPATPTEGEMENKTPSTGRGSAKEEELGDRAFRGPVQEGLTNVEAIIRGVKMSERHAILKPAERAHSDAGESEPMPWEEDGDSESSSEEFVHERSFSHANLEDRLIAEDDDMGWWDHRGKAVKRMTVVDTPSTTEGTSGAAKLMPVFMDMNHRRPSDLPPRHPHTVWDRLIKTRMKAAYFQAEYNQTLAFWGTQVQADYERVIASKRAREGTIVYEPFSHQRMNRFIDYYDAARQQYSDKLADMIKKKRAAEVSQHVPQERLSKKRKEEKREGRTISTADRSTSAMKRGESSKSPNLRVQIDPAYQKADRPTRRASSRTDKGGGSTSIANRVVPP